MFLHLLKNYKTHYPNKLHDYLNKYEGSREDDFINKELEHFNLCLASLPTKIIRIEELNYLRNNPNITEHDLCENKKILYKRIIEFLKDKLNKEVIDNKTEKTTSKKIENWKYVGVKFATGEMYNLLNKHKLNSTAVAKELYGDKFKSYRNIISDTQSDTKRFGTKNIYVSLKKMVFLLDYCNKNKLSVSEHFMKKFRELKEIDAD